MILNVTPYLPTPGILTPENYLRSKALPVQCLSDVAELIDNMRETVTQLNAKGLAATQVSSLQRVVVVMVEGRLTTMVNPIVIKTEGTQRSKEGCLSLRGATATVIRPNVITVKYMTPEKGDLVEVIEVFRGEDSAAVCHELDHLDGILLVDHLTGLNKKFFVKKLTKNVRRVKNFMKHNKIKIQLTQ